MEIIVKDQIEREHVLGNISEYPIPRIGEKIDTCINKIRLRGIVSYVLYMYSFDKIIIKINN